MNISGVRLALERDETGRISVRGFGGGDGSFNLDYILDSLPHLEVVKLTDIDVLLHGVRRARSGGQAVSRRPYGARRDCVAT